MAEIDPELIERTLRWCAEAGRQSTPASVMAALAPLSWDELLAVKALLADPPPIRPLGPFALADISRGSPADVAAERERAGRYGRAEDEAADRAGAPGAAAPAPTARGSARSRKKARPPFVVRRAGARAPPDAPAPRALPLVDELLLDEGRGVLERLLRRHGGRRGRVLAALSAGWRRVDGAALGEADLDRLLVQHSMARVFELRERDEILHALRAAGGVRVRAAAALGLDAPGLDAALDRLGARAAAEKLREERRQSLRARGTLTQRSHLLLDETEQLADLGLLEEFSRDLAARLPDHVRALTAASPEPAAVLLERSLSLDANGIERLLQHTGLKLAELPAAAHPRGGREERRPPARSASRSGATRRPAGAGRPGSRPGDRRPEGSNRAGKGPRAGGRTGDRRSGGPPRTGKGPRPGGRPGGGRPPKRG